MLNCIIVDDEQFSVETLSKYIRMMPDMEITATFNDPTQALISISGGKKIDVLFMDVDMPEISGLELAKAVRAKTDKLIFTTSHSKHAFDAFEVRADAYLLKPFNFIKFSTTVSRLFESKKTANDPVTLDDDYFLVKSKEDALAIVKIRFSEVIAFESAQNYIRIHLTGDKVITAYLTLRDILQLLQKRPGFLQLHRAFIIATGHICHIKGSQVKMSNNLVFTVGEMYREIFSGYIDEKLMVTSRRH
jgi:DNA-binding LytR/AlgR family response regulator